MPILIRVTARMRRFAVKGVLRHFFQFRGARRGRQINFESRIILVDARSEREARDAARRSFEASEYVATWPSAQVARNSLTFLGIARVLEFGPEMERDEVWWELVDERPAVETPGRTAKARPRRPARRRP